jgi:RHS repeat-associated protein
VIGTHNQSAWTQELMPHPQAATPLAKYQDGDTYFVHPNLLRSSTMLTDHSGSEPDGQEVFYYPWGQRWFPDTTPKDYRFASMGTRDEAAPYDLDPTPYRNYSSRLGRWLSPDPSCCCGAGNPQNLNRYPYGANNPANRIDPTGLQPWGGVICFLLWPGYDPCSDPVYFVFHAECGGSPLGYYNPVYGIPPLPSPPRWQCIWIDVGMGGGISPCDFMQWPTYPQWAKDCDSLRNDQCLKCCLDNEDRLKLICAVYLIFAPVCERCVTEQATNCRSHCPAPRPVPQPAPRRKPTGPGH